jgi:glucose-6-phosphate isomerase
VQSFNLNLRCFKKNTNNSKIKKNLNSLIKEKNEILSSLSKKYQDSFNKKLLLKFKKYTNIRIFGMGGSSLGTQAIHEFLNNSIKKKISFFDNLQPKDKKKNNKKSLNLIVSKSGNTIETIVNSNIFIKKKDHNIFITENKKNYLNLLAQKLKSEVVHHNNFIGGRYSVLSEVGMLPAELMGLKSYNFRQLDSLIKNKKFLDSLIRNVSATLYYIKNRRFNSIILNYDENSNNLFNWYQQLIAESLGKKNKGLLPVVSTMPKDNHSVMQFYLDGVKNNFFTFFYVKNKKSKKINNNLILPSQYYLKNKNINNIILSQKIATERVFKKKNIPFRSFEVFKRDEKTLGELFTFFILETILLGKSLNLNPYDQPAVELIKKETKKILI